MQGFLDMVYPRSCMGCGKASPETFRYICWDCWSDASRIEPPFCRRCGDPVAGTIEHDFTCYACSAETPWFDAARSAARYDGVVGEALRQLKYGKALWMACDLAELMLGCLKAEFAGLTFDFVVPVPLYPVRRRERGYNQSAILAAELARRIRCPTASRVLRRIHPTASQTNLTAAQRLSNVQNAFQHGRRNRLAGRRVLLVDDVMTTGATVNACARALKRGGAQSVHVLTVARG
jgi:ComF family protein